MARSNIVPANRTAGSLSYTNHDGTRSYNRHGVFFTQGDCIYKVGRRTVAICSQRYVTYFKADADLEEVGR